MHKTLEQLAEILKTEHEAQIITTTGIRRGEIVHAWSLLLNPGFRHSRWFGPAHSRIFDRIFLVGETPSSPSPYLDEAILASDPIIA